jgi:hypothetical protein
MGISMIFASLSGRLDNDRVTFRDAFLQYSLITNSMFIYAGAAINVLLGRYVGFVRTSKQKQKTGLSQVRWNLFFAAVCFSFSIFALFRSATAGSVEQLRTFLPISLWLLFYASILASSVLFVGESPVPDVHASAVKNTVPNAAGSQDDIHENIKKMREAA